ncbi:hypothetical protein, conserved [Eimeria tenella]|uniref:SPRY domain-containing protein n=1 Tax=Eimeria tenella TaxID=5802 RepID=U6KLJ8_EIMTE|nr:hypothetical protein, conserved [Eimeria tenella]CDJ37701.1 hypothetical protein, conserved [Eimeria tenella]|eukprot:XP_013228539.1 hypothetical protein, conserved [Eimeria tenella]
MQDLPAAVAGVAPKGYGTALGPPGGNQQETEEQQQHSMQFPGQQQHTSVLEHRPSLQRQPQAAQQQQRQEPQQRQLEPEAHVPLKSAAESKQAQSQETALCKPSQSSPVGSSGALVQPKAETGLSSASPEASRASTSPPSSSSDGGFGAADCTQCRNRHFHLPKVVAAPAQSQEELLRLPEQPQLRLDLLKHPEAFHYHCTIPSDSSNTGGKALWWTAAAQRELFLNPYDLAGFPREPRGLPEKRRLAERGAVSVDLGARIHKAPRLQRHDQQQQQQQRESRSEEQPSTEHCGSGSGTWNTPAHSSSHSSSSTKCSRCSGLKLAFDLPREHHAAEGSPYSVATSKGPPIGAALRRRRQHRQQQQQHFSDDSSASSGSDIAAGDLLPDVYLKLAKQPRPRRALGMEADWLMRLQDPPQGIEALDVFAAATAAAAAPAALMTPLASPCALAALLNTTEDSSDAPNCASGNSSFSSFSSTSTTSWEAVSSTGSKRDPTELETALDPRAPYRPQTYLERIAAFARTRARTAPALRLSLPQQQHQQQQQQHCQQKQPLPLLAALISRSLLGQGRDATTPAAGGTSSSPHHHPPRPRKKGLRPLQDEAHQLDSRLLRKSLRCFGRSKGGLSRSSSSSSSSGRIFADFAAVKARLVGLAFGDIPFDPDGLWLRAQQQQQRQQRQQQPQMIDADSQQLQPHQRGDRMDAPQTSTLPLMQAAMRRVRLSAKYRHPSVRISNICGSSGGSSMGRPQGVSFWQMASIDLGCGVVLATHAASAGSFYFEVLVGPVPSQQQQEQLLLQSKDGLSKQQLRQQQQRQLQASSQCDLRVGWSTRRHPPSAPLGATRDSVALTLRGKAAWAGVELPCCFPPLKEGDVVGCCIRLLQSDQDQQPKPQQPQAAAAGSRPAAAKAHGAASASARTSGEAAAAPAGDAYAVSCLMDVDRLAQGFLRSAAGLSESNKGTQGFREAPVGSHVQFTVNGRPLGLCCFEGSSNGGCLLADEYFPAVSLMGGASCCVNFGPSFCYAPPPCDPPYSPSCLLPLPVAPPLTYDVYPLLLLPQQLLADPQLNLLRPRTLADFLEQRVLQPQQQQEAKCQQRHQQDCLLHSVPIKCEALDYARSETHAAVENSVEASEAEGSQGLSNEKEQQQQRRDQLSNELEDYSRGLGFLTQQDKTAASRNTANSSKSCSCRCSMDKTSNSQTRTDDRAVAAILHAASSLVLSPEELSQLQKGLRRQRQQQHLLHSIHRCAFESQLRSCREVLDAAAQQWGTRRAYRLRRKKPWARHRSNLRSSSSSSWCSGSDSSSSSGESVRSAEPATADISTRDKGPLQQGQSQEAESSSLLAAPASAKAAVEGSIVSDAAAPPLPKDSNSSSSSSSSSSTSSNRSAGAPYVDFRHPCSVLFSFLLPTLQGLYPPCTPHSLATAKPQTTAGEMNAQDLTAAGDAVPATEAAAAWKRFARLFWMVVAPLDSQRRPLNPAVFINNEAVAAQRKSRPCAAARAAAAVGATHAASGGSLGGGASGSDSTAKGTGSVGTSSQPTGRSGRPGGAPARRKGGSVGGSQCTASAAAAVSYETVQVGQLLLRVPQGCLADSGDEDAQLPPETPPEALKGKRTAAGGAASVAFSEDDESAIGAALIEPLALPLVLQRRLGLKPRQLMEALGCRFRILSRQLAGSHAAIAGVSCIYTAVVRLRHLQAKAQAAEEEAAKDVACEFWIEQHAGALCGL